MKIAFFSVRDDEIDFIQTFSKKYQIEVSISREALTLETVHECQNAQAVSIMTTKTDEKIIEKLKEYGVIYISTRTIGFDHIDLKACEKYGIHAGNVSYSLASVAEYTVMLILMALRNIKLIVERFAPADSPGSPKTGRSTWSRSARPPGSDPGSFRRSIPCASGPGGFSRMRWTAHGTSGRYRRSSRHGVPRWSPSHG